MDEFGQVEELTSKMPWDLSSESSCNDYLAYEDQDGRGYLLSHLRGSIPCQFIRRRVAQHLRLGNWHWETMLLERSEPHASESWSRPSAGDASDSAP